MKKNNKGYSLVELIIVIAIMALLTGTAFFSINMIFGASAKACANDLKEALAENKVIAMGKSQARIKIYRKKDDGCIYVQQEQYIKEGDAGKWEPQKEAEQIGNSRVFVSYVQKDETEKELPSEDNPLYLCYDRGSGSFSNKSDDCILCEKIYVKGGHRSYELILTELTGKVEIKPR